MMPMIKKTLDRILYVIVAALFALLVFIVVWQVFTRLVLNDPATWTEEGARMTFVWLGLFASALAVGERGHIAVEFLVRKLSEKPERAVAITVQTVILFFALLIFVFGGWAASQNAWNQDLSALPFTVGQMYLALPISGLLIAFYSTYYIIGIAIGAEEPYGDNADEEIAVALEPEIAEKSAAQSQLIDTDDDHGSTEPTKEA